MSIGLIPFLFVINNKNKTLIGAKKKNSTEEIRISKAINETTLTTPTSQKSVSTDVSSKSVQTLETAFVPCESCAKIQTNLKQNADLLINMCHYQNITSQVGKYRASLMSNQLVGGWLSGPDLEKWLIEQDKDLNRISKQLDFLTKNNELMQTKLKENEVYYN